jgi:hypothetical protein
VRAQHTASRARLPRLLWLIGCGLALLLGTLTGGPVAAQQPPAPDVATYESWLREARTAAQRRDRLGLEAAAERLTSVEAVRAADGTQLPVDNRWLRAALETDGSDPDYKQIAERLGALIDGLAQPGHTPAGDAQQQLDEIFAAPPFAGQEEGQSPLDRFAAWVFEILARLFGGAFEANRGAGNPLGWLAAIISALLLLGVLLYLLTFVRRTLTREAQQAASSDPEAHLTAASALQQASSVAREGDYRTAVRYLYLSSLLWLDERDMLRYDRALTNREYLARLADRPDVQARLQPIVDTFDRVWYGYAALDAESFRRYEQQVAALRELRS